MRLALIGGLIADGTGSEPRPGTVLVEGGRISAVLPPAEPVSEAEVIDATGNIVAPGFIDLHSHADFSLGTSPGAASQLAQGVTTLVAGNCGWSPFPVTDLETLKAGTAFLGPRHGWSWTDLAGFAATLEPAVNLALQVGHCTLRIAAMGTAQRAPSAAELRLMQDLLRSAADQGAVGFSTGLIYAPGTYASPEEVAALALEHLGQVTDVDLGWDAYPYTATNTTLTTRLPAWALSGNTLLDRLTDPAERARIAEALRGDVLLSPDTVVIASLPPGPYEACRGLSLTEIARRDGVDAAEVVLRILESHQAAVSVVNHAMREEDVTAVLEHPRTAIASDGWIMDATGPGHPHPRNFGTFPRVLGHYARDRQLFAVSEAIRRMTSLPASRLGWADRGVLRPGAIADLVVLDADQIADKSTYDDPWQPSVGVTHVLVAGQPVLSNGAPTGRRPGRIIGFGD
ncbi:N-acyl-D-amino-acid deacylase [Kribbella aluminosa]|uniref:N-acyl-D-amino-acid deacylase n=1 Tax=Kribbella aluminosa TaxID=416017 RepID=A0ABS4UI92_9ACTN|nr:amidohydrolase family protein [Kribbella aluminosa]MBP2351340.1 N-acyl-D-amino-acid deacylase [Kribbella aluminosa]